MIISWPISLNATTVQEHPEVVIKLLDRYMDVLAEPTALPPWRAEYLSIPFVPGAKPVNIRPYRMNHAKQNAMEEQVEQLLKSKMIKPSLSPYSSPAILVKKKD